MQARGFWLSGALGGGLAVALGAFGAHALRGRLPESLLAVYHTASDYQVYHSLALLVVGVLLDRFPQRQGLRRAGYLLLLGMLIFCGSLYALALTGIRGLGMVTPIGGILLLSGWVWLAVALYRAPEEKGQQ